MSTYSSKPVELPVSAGSVAEKFADLTRMESALEHVPESEREKIGNVSFTTDSISIATQQVGELKFRITERTPERVVFKSESSPLPMDLVVNMKSLAADRTELVTDIKVDLPMMLRPLLGGMMQKAADSFGQLMVKINS